MSPLVKTGGFFIDFEQKTDSISLMNKYLVTGGAGFIGSNIVKKLLEKGEFVRVADNFSSGKKENIKEFMGKANFELLEGDLTDVAFVKKAVSGMDFVVHQAAVASVALSIENPLNSHNTNITATLNLLLAAKEAGVKKLVYASSSSVYGNNPDSPKKEDFAVDPISPYALTKYAGERYAQLFWQMYGFPVTCLRYFNVFGPGQDPFSHYSAVIPKFINAFLKDEKPVVFGTGQQSRDFIYIDNVVQANLLACDAAKGNGEVFNVGSGSEITLNNLIVILQSISGKKIEPEYQTERPGDILHSVADISKAKNALGYHVAVAFADGLKETYTWYAKK